MATSASKGPQLTQRKIDKLRDALHIVRETDQVQEIPRMIQYIDVLLARLSVLGEQHGK